MMVLKTLFPAALALAFALAPSAHAGVELSILPQTTDTTVGSIFEVELTVPVADSPFNGYDAIVTFDPSVLRFVQRSQAEQEGGLMTGACANRFHIFQVQPSGDAVSISHVLLCAGISVTGPGVIYKLQFEALVDQTVTTLELQASFYDAGFVVEPVVVNDAVVRIGDVVSAPFGQRRPQLGVAPNPFNPRTEISIEVPAAGFVRLHVLTTAGRHVDTLLAEPLPAGRRTLSWNASDPRGNPLASGVYWLLLETSAGSAITRVALVR